MEIVLHQFNRKGRKANSSFIQCLKSEDLRLNALNQTTSLMRGCKGILSKYCANSKGYEAWLLCKELLSKNNTSVTPSEMSIALQKYHTCVSHQKSVFDKCIPVLSDECINSKIRAAKVIRLPMENVLHLLEKDPSIRIIHLLRDPRAVVHSRYDVNLISFHVRKESKLKDDQLVSEATILCDRMSKDIQIRLQLEKRYPTNFKEIRYEDISQNPLEIAEDISKFLGLPMTSHIKNWIYNSTHSTKGGGKFSTQRKNSTATAFHWESDVSYRVVKLMSEPCSTVLKHLDYI